jgi:hypothetical protein
MACLEVAEGGNDLEIWSVATKLESPEHRQKNNIENDPNI